MGVKLTSLGTIIAIYVLQLAISFADIGIGLVFDEAVPLDFIRLYYWIPIFYILPMALLLIFFCFLRREFKDKYLVYSFIGLALILLSAKILGDFLFCYYYDVYLGRGMEGGYIEGLPFFFLGIVTYRSTWMASIIVSPLLGFLGMLLLRKGKFL